MQCGGYQQISETGGPRGVGGSAAVVAGVQPPLQPEGVHATSTLRLPGAEELSEGRLSRRRNASGRQSGAGRNARPEEDAAFHHPAKGQPAAVGRSALSTAAERHGADAHGPQATRGGGGGRLDRYG